MRFRSFCTLFLLCLGAIPSQLLAAPPPGFQNESVLSGVGVPMSLLFLPDGRMLVLTKRGEILISDPSVTPAQTSSYMTITNINTGGEKGLIDGVLDPDFSTNRMFYVYYTSGSPATGRIARFEHQENGGGLSSTGNLSSEEVLWEDTDGYPGSDHAHYGGGLDFGPDGCLYLTVGDKRNSWTSQNLTMSGGKVHRIRPDGSIPPDNMGLDDGVGGMPDSMWALGLRNPFRAFWDLPTERYIIAEVGGNNQATAWEDIHLGRARANYGWDICEGPCDNSSFPRCMCGVHDDPMFTYPHLGVGASLTGGVVYRGGSFPPSYEGVYFYSDWVRLFTRYLTFDPDDPTVVTGDFEFDPSTGTVIFMEEGPGGDLYFTLFDGQIRRYSFGDDDPPLVRSARQNPSSDTQVSVVFSEAVSETTAEEVSNYSIDNGVTVLGAELESTSQVLLTTSSLPSGPTLTLTVNGVEDVIGNVIAPNTQIPITASTAGEPPRDGLELWLDAGQGTLLNGDIVTEWRDQATDDALLHDGSALGQPTLASHTFPNGSTLPVVRFDNSDGFVLDNPEALSLPNFSIYAVVRHNVAVPSQIIIANFNERGFALGIADRIVGRVKFYTSVPTESMEPPGAQLTDGAATTLTATYSGGNKKLYVDGQEVGSRSGLGISYGGTVLMVGTLFGTSQFFQGDIAEILVYEGVSPDQQYAVEGYLNAKYFETSTSETRIFAASQDNTLFEDRLGALSNGNGHYLFTSVTRQDEHLDLRRGLIAFDLSSRIPPGASILDATLHLNMSRTISTAHPVSLHRGLTRWGEGASDATLEEGWGAAAQPGDSTWLHSNFPLLLWNQPGGDFDPSPSGTVDVVGVGPYVWSTPEMRADVQHWVDNPDLNFGWFLIGNESVVGSAKRFDSREHPGLTRRPRLAVTFSCAPCPPAAGNCCLGDGSCATLTEEDCATAGGLYQGDGTICGLDPCPPFAPFVRGECNGDGVFDVIDPMDLLFSLFGTVGMPDCPEACDANGDSLSDIADAVFALTFLYLNGTPPPSPFPECGIEDDLNGSLGCSDSACP